MLEKTIQAKENKLNVKFVRFIQVLLGELNYKSCQSSSFYHLPSGDRATEVCSLARDLSALSVN